MRPAFVRSGCGVCSRWYRQPCSPPGPGAWAADRQRPASPPIGHNAVAQPLEKLARNRTCYIIGYRRLGRVYYAHAQQVTAHKREWFKSSWRRAPPWLDSKIHAAHREGARLMSNDTRPVGAVTGEARTTSDKPRADTAGAPTVLRILLGTQLRRLRESRGISAQDAAKAIRGSEPKISRIELGRNAVREVDIADLLNLYGIADMAEREQLLTLASQANQQGWWHRYQDVLPAWFQSYIGLEESAESIRSFDAQFVPGLLQTEDYSTAVIQLGAYSAEDTDRLVYLRKERQRRFASGGLRLWAVIDEMALRRPVGTPALRRAQLEHLLEIADRPGLTIQVTPFLTGASYAAPGSFSILRFGTD